MRLAGDVWVLLLPLGSYQEKVSSASELFSGSVVQTNLGKQPSCGSATLMEYYRFWQPGWLAARQQQGGILGNALGVHLASQRLHLHLETLLFTFLSGESAINT